MTEEGVTSHIVGSLYDFSETAGHEIVSLVEKKSNQDTKCYFNDGSLFTVHAAHDDKSLAYLVHTVRNFISVEKNKEPDLFEDQRMVRKGGTHSNSTLAALIEKRMQVIKPNNGLTLIEHENIIRKWSPSSESKELGLKLSLQLLGRVEHLCGCRIEQASDSAELLIKADREQDIEKGTRKLERLNKMMVDEASFPRIHSFYVLEGETSINLRLIALKDLDDKRLVTTLLQKDSPIKSLRGLRVLVLVRGSNIVPVRLKPAAPNQRRHLWNEYISNCGQVQVQDLIAARTPKEPVTPIGKWVSEIPDPDVQMDVFRPQSAVEVQQVGKLENYIGTVDKETSLPMKKSTTKRARTTRGNPDAFNKAFVKPQDGFDGKEATSQENMKNLNYYQSTETVPTGTKRESRRHPPSIEAPYMPPLAIPSPFSTKTPSINSQQLTPSSASWNAVVRGSKSGSLIDMSVPNEGRAQDDKPKLKTMIVADKLQDTNMIKAQDFRYTMNQRKAPTRAFVAGDTALVKSFEEITLQLLALALPRTGRIGFAVDIGRFLIKEQCSSSEFKNRSFKTSEFSSVLPQGRKTDFEPLFTNMLTVRSSEAESILNVLMSQGRRLFQQEPASRKVRYVSSCKTKGVDNIVIEFDEDGDFSVQGPEILIGALDWHFPKRVWDARLRLTNEKYLTTDYQRQVKGIVDNLRIVVSGDDQPLELWTKTIDKTVSIESITRRRETVHPATIYPDLLLHLVECQDLQVRQPSDSESIYSGSIQTSDVMIKTNRLWWEARISSINATNILKDNMMMELGENAMWSPSSIISKGVVRDLFAVAKEIVTQIDHVGYFNRGRDSSDSRTAEKPSEDTQDIPASLSRVDPAFW